MRVIIGLLLLQLVLSPVLAVAQSNETEEERKKRIEGMLMQVEKQIFESKKLVDGKRQERQSLERDLDLIDAEIDKAQLGIQARSLAIEQLNDQIEDKEEVLEVLDSRLDKQRTSLAEIMRQTQAIDDFSLAEVMLSNKNFSDFFDDIDNFNSVKQSLNDSLEILEEIKRDTHLQKSSLEEKQQTEAEMKRLQELEKLEIEKKEDEKEEILEVTRGEEERYQNMLESQQKTAAQLRAQLFELLGGGGAIPFPEAVGYAKAASAQTGVSAALILAILEQESAFGSNIGSCTYDQMSHGRAVMHPDRDAPVFEAMAQTLGFSAATQQVSCPWIRSGERIGWGGAMGASQFIPSTWAIYGGFVDSGSGWVYDQSRDAIRTLLGKNTPSSPFVNRDAFMATALLMRDNGAAGTYDSEWTAAVRYFSGWAGASNPVNHPYGDSVMKRKARLENEIRILDAG